MNGIDPQQFGRLTAQVETLEKIVEKMAGQMETLMEIVNKGRGAFWLAIFVGGSISTAVTYIATKFGFGGLLK